MSEDYLWDKSGKPDPEIQQLEQILGSLKYQPRELELPEEIPTARRKSYLPLLAIAATLLVAAFAGLLWFRLHNTAPKPQGRLAETPPASQAKPEPTAGSNLNNEKEQKPNIAKTPIPKANNQLAVHNIRRIHKPEIVPTEEALHAKEQLMTALRLASEKLNLAQRKAQGPASPNQIRNQHKIG